jgi:hypothetical protein
MSKTVAADEPFWASLVGAGRGYHELYESHEFSPRPTETFYDGLPVRRSIRRPPTFPARRKPFTTDFQSVAASVDRPAFYVRRTPPTPVQSSPNDEDLAMTDSPFLRVPETQWVLCNSLAFANGQQRKPSVASAESHLRFCLNQSMPPKAKPLFA